MSNRDDHSVVLSEADSKRRVSGCLFPELSQDTEFENNKVITPSPFVVVHFDLKTLFSYIMFIYWS